MDKSNVEVTVEEIDNILDEIEENEHKVSIPSSQVDWKQILTEIREGNTTYIKSLITSKDISINEQDPSNGKTLCIYVTIIGNYELVKLVCNFGADVHIKDHDNKDALDYAQVYGRYSITRLLFYRQLSGSLGNDLKNIAIEIYERDRQAEALFAASEKTFGSGRGTFITIQQALIELINDREPFDPILMDYAWWFYRNKEVKEGFSGWGEDFWKAIIRNFDEIITDTTNKKDWAWLKEYFMKSLIWYLPNPFNETKDKNTDEKKDEESVENNMDDDGEMESQLKQTLFWELLKRIRIESKRQSDLLLQEKINDIKANKPQEWKELISYNVSTKFSNNARQDECGCIEPIYLKDDLSEDKYPPSTHFSALKHYDTNIYLQELLFRANILDTMFQFDMKKITNEINLETGNNSIYRAGPVKTKNRSTVKVENDYINEAYPTSAKILDINRCAIGFNTIEEMMKYIQIFTTKINDGKAYCVVDIIRCKNGWSIYAEEYPTYTDIKLNVLVKSPNNQTIVTEVQLLLKLMSSFKKVAHKLYSIERRFELIYNFKKLQNTMNEFKDIDGSAKMIICFITNNQLSDFKLYWSIMASKTQLTGPAIVLGGYENVSEIHDPWKSPFINALLHENADQIYIYLKKEYGEILYETMKLYFQKFVANDGGTAEEGYYKLIKNLSYKFEKAGGGPKFVLKFVKKIFDLIGNDVSKIMELFQHVDPKDRTFVSALIYIHWMDLSESVNYILNQPALSLDNKLELFCGRAARIAAFNQSKLNSVAKLLYYCDKYSKNTLMDLLFNTSKSKYGHGLQAGFNLIVTSRDERTLLPYILSNPNLTIQEKHQIICNKKDDKRYSGFEWVLRSDSFQTQLLLNFMDPKKQNWNTEQIINSISNHYIYSRSWNMSHLNEEKSKEIEWSQRLDFVCVLTLLKHVSHNKKCLYTLLSDKGFWNHIT
eukprot:26502_1